MNPTATTPMSGPSSMAERSIFDSHSYPDALPPGHRIKGYEIQDVLGRDGFSVTYRALDLDIHETVAIREYLPLYLAVRATDGNVLPISLEEADDYKRGLKHYLKEAKTLIHIDHPSIVCVEDYFKAHGTGYIVMEYIEGETLETMLYTMKPHVFDATDLNRMIEPVIDGLEAAHEAGILHRDITPGKIVIDDISGTPVLTGFGAVRDISRTHSRIMALMGIPRYAAPEQIMSQEELGTWTDIYGLSAVVLQCVTNSSPPSAVERMQFDCVETLVNVCSGENKYRLPQGVMAATKRGLALNPQERPQTVSEWRAFARQASQATVDKYQQEAEKGDEEAQYFLGHMYEEGIDAPQDRNAAIKWYESAAKQGHHSAESSLGFLFYSDWHREHNFKKVKPKVKKQPYPVLDEYENTEDWKEDLIRWMNQLPLLRKGLKPGMEPATQVPKRERRH